MSLNLKNTVCNPDDALTKLKKEILELIQLKKITCNNLPNVDFSLPSIPSINPSQAVIELLMDIISLLNGINFDQMRMGTSYNSKNNSSFLTVREIRDLIKKNICREFEPI